VSMSPTSKLAHHSRAVNSCKSKSAERRRGSFTPVADLPDFAAIAAQAECDGLYALPACLDPAEKHPCVKWKHLQERRPPRDEIAEWVRRYQWRNGVYLTGPVLGRFVLDPDSAQALAWVRRKGLPPTQQVVTSRGRHFHFAYPKGLHVGNTAGAIYKNVDIRGAKGVAVAVGSVHESGFTYRWARGCSPQDVKLAKAPDWLLDWLRERAARQAQSVASAVAPRQFSGNLSPWAVAVIERELADLCKAQEGTRNASLARISFKFGQLASGGQADATELMIAICEVAKQWPNQKKSFDTIERAFAAGQAHQRNAPPSVADQLAALWVAP
jgi:hypothetical protein